MLQNLNISYCEKNKFKEEENNELYEIITDLVGGSCYAITISGDIIYNAYERNYGNLEKELQEYTRDSIINNPSLICIPKPHMFVQIYMFYNNPICINLNYDNGYFELSCYN